MVDGKELNKKQKSLLIALALCTKKEAEQVFQKVELAGLFEPEK